MERVEDTVREIIKERYRSIAEFAREIGVPERTVYSLLNVGSLAGSSFETVMRIVEALELDPFKILEGRVVKAPEINSVIGVPVVENWSPGELPTTSDDGESFPIPADLHARHPRSFMLKMNDESMNCKIAKGCYVLVDPEDKRVKDGLIYALNVDDQPTRVRHTRALNNGIEALPDSTDTTFRKDTIDFGNPNGPKVKDVGRIVWFCTPLNWDQQ